MAHEKWHKKPYIATALQEAIQRESQEEVVKLNQLTDEYIFTIESNEALYNDYYGKLMKVKEAIEAIKKFWADTRETREKVKAAIKAASLAETVANAQDKASTISMSLNPVVAAVQYSVKILRELLRSEINALGDVQSVLQPAENEFIAFSGGHIVDPKTGKATEVVGTFNEKIAQMEIRLQRRKLLREKKKLKLQIKKAKRKGLSTDELVKALEAINNNRLFK